MTINKLLGPGLRIDSCGSGVVTNTYLSRHCRSWAVSKAAPGVLGLSTFTSLISDSGACVDFVVFVHAGRGLRGLMDGIHC